jgi:aerobic C4-dicarboxylate transport protein
MRSLTNLAGNAVATIVVAKWENEFDSGKAGVVQVGGAVEASVAMASGD